MQDLLNRVDIVDVVDALRAAEEGRRELRAPAARSTTRRPRRSPSARRKQFYHCFGCGAHGNAIGFLMEYAGLGYVDAMQELAESVGMQVPEMRARAATARADEAPRPLRRACATRGAVLPRAAQDVAARHRIPQGARPLRRDRRALRHRLRAGRLAEPAAPRSPTTATKPLVDCGLVIENEQGRRYDRFRDRIMFPILNSARLRDRLRRPRHRRRASPSTSTRPRRRCSRRAASSTACRRRARAIRDAGRVLVVEGYMDVVALAQHGVGNAVATLGTATTPMHVPEAAAARRRDRVLLRRRRRRDARPPGARSR